MPNKISTQIVAGCGEQFIYSTNLTLRPLEKFKKSRKLVLMTETLERMHQLSPPTRGRVPLDTISHFSYFLIRFHIKFTGAGAARAIQEKSSALHCHLTEGNPDCKKPVLAFVLKCMGSTTVSTLKPVVKILEGIFGVLSSYKSCQVRLEPLENPPDPSSLVISVLLLSCLCSYVYEPTGKPGWAADIIKGCH